MWNHGEEMDTGHLPTGRHLGAHFSYGPHQKPIHCHPDTLFYVYECWMVHVWKCTTRMQCLEVQKRVSDPLGLFVSFQQVLGINLGSSGRTATAVRGLFVY